MSTVSRSGLTEIPGFIPGTSVVCEGSIKPIETLSFGDNILGAEGHSYPIILSRKSVLPTVSLITQGSTPSLVSGNQLFWVRQRFKKWNNTKRGYDTFFSDPKKVKAFDLSKGFYVGTPISVVKKNPYKLTRDECFLLGVYIGDGHTRKDFRVSEGRPNDRHWQLIISVGSHELDLFKKLVKLKYRFYSHSKSVYRAVFSSKRLVELAETHCGVGAYNKFLSKMILDLPVPLLKAVIGGYEFADGSQKGGVYKATSVSKSLVETLSLAVAKVYKTTCCINFTVRPRKTFIEGRCVNQKDTWTIIYRKRLPKASRAFVLDNYVWNPVKSVQNHGLSEVISLFFEKDVNILVNCLEVCSLVPFEFE